MTPAESDTAKRLAAVVLKIETAKILRDHLIRKAMDEGASAREVAELAGISHTWVLKIWKDEG